MRQAFGSAPKPDCPRLHFEQCGHCVFVQDFRIFFYVFCHVRTLPHAFLSRFPRGDAFLFSAYAKHGAWNAKRKSRHAKHGGLQCKLRFLQRFLMSKWRPRIASKSFSRRRTVRGVAFLAASLFLRRNAFLAASLFSPSGRISGFASPVANLRAVPPDNNWRKAAYIPVAAILLNFYALGRCVVATGRGQIGFERSRRRRRCGLLKCGKASVTSSAFVTGKAFGHLIAIALPLAIGFVILALASKVQDLIRKPARVSRLRSASVLCVDRVPVRANDAAINVSSFVAR